jgi:hypothetical protein
MAKSIIDRVTGHFASLQKKEIHVPEWGVTIHASPITVADMDVIDRAKGVGAKAVAILLRKAKDERGEPVFSATEEWDLLNKADPLVVDRVATQIFGGGAGDNLGESSGRPQPSAPPGDS